jgi:hypothetical protein
MDISEFAVWAIIAPAGLILWVGMIGFVIWLITEPLADTAEKVSAAWYRGKRRAAKGGD